MVVGNAPVPPDQVRDVLIRGLEADAATCEAALCVIRDFGDLSAGMVSAVVDLMHHVVPIVGRAERAECELAIDALRTLCKSCDDEVLNLFAEVWSHSESISPLLLPKYLGLLGKVLQLSKQIDDDFMDDILGFVETMIDSPGLLNRVGALSIISVLLAQYEDLRETLVPPSLAILQDAFEFPNADVHGAALDFLEAISVNLKQELIAIVQPFLPFVQESLSEEPTSQAIGALIALSVYTGYTLDLQLVEQLAQLVGSYLKDGRMDGQWNGLFCLTHLARALAGQPIASSLFELVAETLETCEETDVAERCFDAMRRVFKYCHGPDPGWYFGKSIELVTKFMEGGVRLLKGTPAAESAAAALPIQGLMEFLGTLFAAGPPDIDPLCDFLMQ
jgi:hypothetical protein